MTAKVRLWFAGVMLAAAMSFVSLTNGAAALGEKDNLPAVIKIGDSFKSGDAAGAKKAAPAVAKKFDEPSDLMHLFRARSVGGVGWGLKPSAVPKDKEDGLEKKVIQLAKGVPATFKDYGAAEEAGYALAAMAEITIHKPTPKAVSGAGKKAWTEYSEQMRDASLEFAKAAKGMKGADLSKAAAKVNAACNSCHSKFKD